MCKRQLYATGFTTSGGAGMTNRIAVWRIMTPIALVSLHMYVQPIAAILRVAETAKPFFVSNALQ